MSYKREDINAHRVHRGDRRFTRVFHETATQALFLKKKIYRARDGARAAHRRKALARGDRSEHFSYCNVNSYYNQCVTVGKPSPEAPPF